MFSIVVTIIQWLYIAKRTFKRSSQFMVIIHWKQNKYTCNSSAMELLWLFLLFHPFLSHIMINELYYEDTESEERLLLLLLLLFFFSFFFIFLQLTAKIILPYSNPPTSTSTASFFQRSVHISNGFWYNIPTKITPYWMRASLH